MELTKNANEDATETAKPEKPKKRRNPFNTEQLKEEKERRQKKRARLIVRNISYKATEDALRQHFGQWGTLEDVSLLKRADGKLVGCAFVQYESVNQATKAILRGNNQPMLGRPVYVDWALGKNEYTSKKKEQEEPEEKKTKVEAKEEDGDNNASVDEEGSVKEESDDENEDDDDQSIKSEEDDEDSNASGADEEDDDKDANESDEDDDDDKKKSKLKLDQVKKEKHISNDVNQGCTVFIKNVHFDAQDLDLRKVCRKFGPVYYSIINRDHVSGHSRGTAFVKFKTKDSADLCLQAGTEFTLLDQVLDPHPALSRDEIRTQTTDKSKRDDAKDSRNLYLAREGLIMSGSKAADDVSANDMTRRHKLEQVKTQVLKNLNRFVSRNRLSIHNLPLNYDNDKLKQMATAYTSYKPHECRVMRENKVTPEHPHGKSKGFGFLSFNTHQEALTALRKINNNPEIFGPLRRPIVAFSIEDRAVHKIKEQRKEKSKTNNPTFQAKQERRKEQRKQKLAGRLPTLPKGPQSDNKDRLKKHIKKLEESRASNANAGPNNKEKQAQEFDSYVGMASKSGTSIRMRSNKKIGEQAEVHLKRVKADKRKEKQRKIKQSHLAERKAIDRPKQGRKVERDDLSQLVNKYKRMIDSSANAGNSGPAADGASKTKKPKRTKWYTE